MASVAVSVPLLVVFSIAVFVAKYNDACGSIMCFACTKKYTYRCFSFCFFAFVFFQIRYIWYKYPCTSVLSVQEFWISMLQAGLKPIELRHKKLGDNVHKFMVLSKSGNCGKSQNKFSQKRLHLRKMFARLSAQFPAVQVFLLELMDKFGFNKDEQGVNEFIAFMIENWVSKTFGFISFGECIDLKDDRNAFVMNQYRDWILYDSNGRLKYRYAWVVEEIIPVDQTRNAIHAPGNVSCVPIKSSKTYRQVNQLLFRKLLESQITIQNGIIIVGYIILLIVVSLNNQA